MNTGKDQPADDDTMPLNPWSPDIVSFIGAAQTRQPGGDDGMKTSF